MGWNRALFWAAFAVAASPLLAAKPVVPIPLARIGPWEINFDDDSCHLISTFGSGKNQLVVRFTRYQPGDNFSLALMGLPMKYVGSRPKMKLDFGPQIDPQIQWSFDGKIGAHPVSVFNSITLIDNAAKSPKAEKAANITPEQEAAVRDLTILANDRNAYRLALGSMAAPMQALRNCTTDLVQQWGLDPAEQASLSRKPTPIGNPSEWLSWEDFPSDMLDRGGTSLVHFRLDIEETGGITGCHIQFRTNPDKFADQTCKMLRARAKLEPALDQGGKPIKSYYVTSVRWGSWGF